jgi:hypothetical protein
MGLAKAKRGMAMKIFVKTTLLGQSRFLITVFTDGKMTDQITATLGTVINVRNELLDRLTNLSEVMECEANAIPFSIGYAHRPHKNEERDLDEVRRKKGR